MSLRSFDRFQEEETEKELELKSYITSYKKLDNNVNQFFENYQNLKRTSFKMAEVWSAVMYCRTQMVCSLTHMQDEERFLDSAFKEERIMEMKTFIDPLRMSVSRAVGILTLFIKNTDTEKLEEGFKWHYERSSFLLSLCENLKELLCQQTDNWRDFLLELYEVQAKTAKAYRVHLLEESERNYLKLAELEAERTNIAIPQWKAHYTNVFAKNSGTKEKLGYLVMLEDVHALIKDTNAAEGCLELMQQIRTHCGLSEEYKKRSSFMELKDYQMGLSDLGPFGVSPLDKPNKFFKAVTTPGEHEDGSKYYGYLELIDNFKSQEFYRIFRFNWYKCNMSVLTPIRMSSVAQAKLSIPSNATHFTWVFPNIDDTKVALQTNPDKIKAINEYKKGEDAITCVMATGGFAYFDSKGQFLALNGIYLFGDDMFFDGPYDFPKEKEEEYFGGSNEMQEVTVPFLRDVFGCDQFGWIATDEELGITTGAFYYKYSTADKAPNYFKFLDFENAKLKKLKNNNTPGIQYLETLYPRFKDMWSQEDQLKELGNYLVGRPVSGLVGSSTTNIAN